MQRNDRRHGQKRKHDLPFYNVNHTYIVKGFEEGTGIYVRLINKKTNTTVQEVKCDDKEQAFKKAFDLEMEIIGTLKREGDLDSVNPKAVAAFHKHEAWKDREHRDVQ